MELQARLWGNDRRVREAANVPYRSIYARDTGTMAVVFLKRALLKIAAGSHLLPTRLLPRPGGPNGPPGVAWGPFDFRRPGQDPTLPEPSPYFNAQTDLMVQKFQRQEGSLDADGKAGIHTLRRLDEIVAFLEQKHPSEV